MSNDAGFVKGPWSIDPLGIGTPWNVGTIADDVAMVAPLVADRDNAIRAANARLIASAPDLYEACRLAAGALEALGASSDAAICRAALAKANGSTQTEATSEVSGE